MFEIQMKYENQFNYLSSYSFKVLKVLFPKKLLRNDTELLKINRRWYTHSMEWFIITDDQGLDG
jgi:hypothetical protein